MTKCLGLLLAVLSMVCGEDIIPPLKQHFEYVLPPSCISTITAGPNTKCAGPDKEKMICTGLVITVKGKLDDCLQINVVKDK